MDTQKLIDLKHFNYNFMGYTPQPLQERVHESGARILIISGGERGGKSITTAAEIASRYGTWSSVLIVCYKSKSAKNEANDIYQFLEKFGAVKKFDCPEEGTIELITKDGMKIESVSTYAEGARAVSGTGQSYDVIAMVEAGKQKYEVFQSCLIRASATSALLIISGTIEKSQPWFPDVIRRLEGENDLGAKVFYLPTWENRYYYTGRNDPKILAIEKEIGEDLFLERCAGKPAPSHSLVLKEFSYLTHVFDWVNYDPSQTVEAWIDYGYSGSHYSVAFVQFHPRAYTRQFYPTLPDAPLTDVWVIGDLYLSHAVHEEVITQAKHKPYWNHVTGGVGDVVGKTHPQAGQSPFDVWRDKANIALRGQYILVDDNIDRQITFLKDPSTQMPRIFFNPSCKGIAEFGRWKRKEIGENIFGSAEAKNCDFLKALGYGLIDHFGRIEKHSVPQVIAVGKRVSIDQSAERLPTEMGTRQPVTQVVMPSPRQQYVVVPRHHRNPLGGGGYNPPDNKIV